MDEKELQSIFEKYPTFIKIKEINKTYDKKIENRVDIRFTFSNKFQKYCVLELFFTYTNIFFNDLFWT